MNSLKHKCKTCGQEFVPRRQSRNSEGDGTFCSRKYWVPHNKTTKVATSCQWCGKVFLSLAIRDQKYCSHECGCLSRKKSKKKTRGRSRYELAKWANAVILRDKACMRCGAAENLQAHHVKPWSKFPELGMEIENGVALCAVCHHFHHPKIPLSTFLSRGGKKVQRCAFCESPYVPGKKKQRTCSRSCGRRLQIQRAPA